MMILKTYPCIHRAITCMKSLRLPSIHFPNHRFLRLPPLHLAPSCYNTSSSSTSDMPLISTVEHVVLFKVRDSTDPSKVDTMIANLRSLASLNIATHLTAGPILRPRSADAESFGSTHLLFSRYRSKADLATYSAHPRHTGVVKENVLPICDDIMAVDWIAEVDAYVPPSPALLKFTLVKPREGTEANEVFEAIDRVRVSVPDSVKVSYGENFSPGRAKGYKVGFISVYSDLYEVGVIEGNEEVIRQKEKMKPLLESVIVVDYLVRSPASSL